MRNFQIYFILLISCLLGCTDSESEEIIEGQWHAETIKEIAGAESHALPEGITLDFEYPKYSFKGEQSEMGNYYIKDNQLHLIPNDEEEKREIKIIYLSPDSLTLHLVDSLGSRSVLFLRK